VDDPIGRVTYEIARRFLKMVDAPVGANVWSGKRVCNEYFKIPTRNRAVRSPSGSYTGHCATHGLQGAANGPVRFSDPEKLRAVRRPFS
jgi:hypothetical protein